MRWRTATPRPGVGPRARRNRPPAALPPPPHPLASNAGPRAGAFAGHRAAPPEPPAHPGRRPRRLRLPRPPPPPQQWGGPWSDVPAAEPSDGKRLSRKQRTHPDCSFCAGFGFQHRSEKTPFNQKAASNLKTPQGDCVEDCRFTFVKVGASVAFCPTSLNYGFPTKENDLQKQ